MQGEGRSGFVGFYRYKCTHMIYPTLDQWSRVGYMTYHVMVQDHHMIRRALGPTLTWMYFEYRYYSRLSVIPNPWGYRPGVRYNGGFGTEKVTVAQPHDRYS